MNPEHAPKPPVDSSAELPILATESSTEHDVLEVPIERAIVPRQPAAPAAAPTRDRLATAVWSFVLPFTLMAAVFMILLWVMPHLLFHWRAMDARTEADAIYTKRRAELKAEAEHADERLESLDRKATLTSMGFREVARKALPSVVNIINFREPTKEDAEKRVRLVYDPDDDRRYVHQSIGSGVIFKPGVILTNDHVLRGAKRVRVTFASGRSIGVDIGACATDSLTDLAVVRLPDNLPAGLKEDASQSAAFADSAKDVQIGDWTLAIGSPLDYRQTVTQGIISAKGRMVPLEQADLVELLQTDAAINQGSSGGPLFDQLGRVVGISVAMAVEERGIGFAIPSNTAKKVGELLVTKGEVPRGYLGIKMDDVPAPKLKENKIDDGAVWVRDVLPGSAAAIAGLKSGDIITRVNNEPLQRWRTVRHFQQLVADMDPGAEVTFEIVRDAKRRPMAVKLGKRPRVLK